MRQRYSTTRRDFLVGASASLAASATNASAQPRIVMNDASRLNPTPTIRHWTVTERGDERIALLRKELKDAASAKRPVVIGAARPPGGAAYSSV